MSDSENSEKDETNTQLALLGITYFTTHASPFLIGLAQSLHGVDYRHLAYALGALGVGFGMYFWERVNKHAFGLIQTIFGGSTIYVLYSGGIYLGNSLR